MRADINEKDFLEYYKTSLAEENDEEPPPRIARPNPRRLFGAALISIVALFAGLAAAGYLIFSNTSGSVAVTVLVDGPSEVPAGAESLFTVTLSNGSQLPLSDLSLIASFPDGFSFSSASEEPKNSKKNYWAIDSMRPLEKKIIAVRGTFAGVKDDKKTVAFSFRYHQRGISAEFEAQGAKDTILASSSLSIHPSGPSQARVGERITYTIAIDDPGSLPNADRLELRVTPPQGFHVETITPKPDHDFIWTAQSLLGAGGAKKPISLSITGTFDDSAASQTRTLLASIGIAEASGFSSYQDTPVETAVSAEDFYAKLFINGSDEVRPIPLDAPALITIPLENKGAALITDTAVTLTAESPIIDWLALENPHGGVLSNQNIRWTERELPALKLLKAGERAELRLVLRAKPLSDIPSAALATPGLSIALKLSVSGTKTNAVGGSSMAGPFTLQPVSIRLPYNSDTRFQMKEDVLGTTRWTITNSLHELSNLRISAKLAAGRSWSDATRLDAGEMSYNESKRLISWSLNRMPTSVKNLSVEFDVAAASSSTASILEPVLTAKDSVTGGTITLRPTE